MPILLDLFCGGGGSAEGYHKAGFTVVGVDNVSQPSYPYEFYLSDAFEFLADNHREFDLIHASPPCQGYSIGSNKSSMPRLIGKVREVLRTQPYIIENVVGAKYFMHSPIFLCGFMFGLHIRRHRLFETSFRAEPPIHFKCLGKQLAYAQSRGWESGFSKKSASSGKVERYQELLGVEHQMTIHELVEAIPPVYTNWLGRKFLGGNSA